MLHEIIITGLFMLRVNVAAATAPSPANRFPSVIAECSVAEVRLVPAD